MSDDETSDVCQFCEKPQPDKLCECRLCESEVGCEPCLLARGFVTCTECFANHGARFCCPGCEIYCSKCAVGTTSDDDDEPLFKRSPFTLGVFECVICRYRYPTPICDRCDREGCRVDVEKYVLTTSDGEDKILCPECAKE